MQFFLGYFLYKEKNELKSKVKEKGLEKSTKSTCTYINLIPCIFKQLSYIVPTLGIIIWFKIFFPFHTLFFCEDTLVGIKLLFFHTLFFC